METLAIVLGIAVIIYIIWRFKTEKPDRSIQEGGMRQVAGLGIVSYPPNMVDTPQLLNSLIQGLFSARMDTWAQMCVIYKQTAVYQLSHVNLVWTMPHVDHAAVELDRAKNTITLLLGGYQSKSEEFWFVSELHNLYRWTIGLPYAVSDRSDMEKYSKTLQYIEEHYS